MSENWESFYFPSHGVRLFGIFYPSQLRNEGIVICPPAPQETMRSYHAHVQLARKLQEMGYAVLRFDYAGTGDSEGSAQSLEEWRANISSAVAQLKRMSAVARISLLGTRLGAALAVQVSQKMGLKRLVLWDPIENGSDLVQAYRKAHDLMLNRVPVEAPFVKNQKTTEQLCGFPFPKSLEEEMKELRPDTLTTPCRRILLVQEKSSEAWNQLTAGWRQEGSLVQEILTEETLNWESDIYMRLQAFPSLSLKAITQAFEDN